MKDLSGIFDSFVHTRKDLKRCKKGHPKLPDSKYRNVKEQNYLVKTVFDHLNHQNCIKNAFKVSTTRLACLRKIIQTERTKPFVEKEKEWVSQYSDVVLPRD